MKYPTSTLNVVLLVLLHLKVHKNINILLVTNLVNKTEGYDLRCDIFSAGIIFHILLLGESLFGGKGHLELLR